MAVSVDGVYTANGGRPAAAGWHRRGEVVGVGITLDVAGAQVAPEVGAVGR